MQFEAIFAAQGILFPKGKLNDMMEKFTRRVDYRELEREKDSLNRIPRGWKEMTSEPKLTMADLFGKRFRSDPVAVFEAEEIDDDDVWEVFTLTLTDGEEISIGWDGYEFQKLDGDGDPEEEISFTFDEDAARERYAESLCNDSSFWDDMIGDMAAEYASQAEDLEEYSGKESDTICSDIPLELRKALDDKYGRDFRAEKIYFDE